ncbi:MAG: PaaI family thioesterase [Actinocrinis sp.]
MTTTDADQTQQPAPGAATAAATPTTPPADALPPQRHPEAPSPGTELGQHYPMCFACGEQQANGLHLKVFADEGVAVTAKFEVGPPHQGAPGLIHGGLLTLAFDEVMGAVHWMLRTPAVTGRLETDFLKPVPLGRTVYLSARCVGVHGRKLYHRAEGRLDGPDGQLVARAAALFVEVRLGHFAEHGRAEEVQAVLDRPDDHQMLRAFEVNP